MLYYLNLFPFFFEEVLNNRGESSEPLALVVRVGVAVSGVAAVVALVAVLALEVGGQQVLGDLGAAHVDGEACVLDLENDQKLPGNKKGTCVQTL